MMDPSSRRVDYLDLATPQSARAFRPSHYAPRRPHSPTLGQQSRPHPALDDMAPIPPAQAPIRMLPHLHPIPPDQAPPRPFHPGRQIGAPHRRARKRAGLREHDQEVYQELAAEAGIAPHHMVSSMQDLFDANYPYKGTPWVLQDIGHKAPAIWRAIAALAVRAPYHLPAAIRDKVHKTSSLRAAHALCPCP